MGLEDEDILILINWFANQLSINIDMEKIKELREKTGAGMVECKKALEEAGGDIEKAVEILRKKGSAKAAKKADRITNEGMVVAKNSSDNKKVSIVKILCETDFVARNADFQAFVTEVAEKGLSQSAEEYFNSKKDEIILKVGENLVFGGAVVLSGEFISSYIHSNNKLATAIVFNKTVDASLANDIAMHTAAMSPSYLAPSDVPETEIEKEKEIYREQLKQEGKPTEIVEKILLGKVNKYYEDVCLLKQYFIKDDKKTVEQFLKEADGTIKIEEFSRINL